MCAAEQSFQSTLPTRGSDQGKGRAGRQTYYFNPRSPRGGATLTRPLSPRCLPANFNPRSPRGGATVHIGRAYPVEMVISIHAPHEGERPLGKNSPVVVGVYFNPRSPRGGATSWVPFCIIWGENFNPRSPRGGATS